MACVSKAWRSLCDDPVCWPSLRLPFGFRGVFGQGVAGRDGGSAAAGSSSGTSGSGDGESKGDSKRASASTSALLAGATSGSQLFAALSAKFTSLKTLQLIGPRLMVSGASL